MKCPLCGKERRIGYDLAPWIKERLKLSEKLPCLDCLVGLAEEENVELPLGEFHYLGDFIDEDLPGILDEIQALVRRLATRGVLGGGKVHGSLYVGFNLELAWEFSARFVDPEEKKTCLHAGRCPA